MLIVAGVPMSSITMVEEELMLGMVVMMMGMIPTMDSFSQSLLLLSPKKVQRGYFHAVVEDGQ